MPTFTYADDQGRTVTVNRDTEPTDAELDQLFAAQSAKPQGATAPASVLQFAGQLPRSASPATPTAEVEVMDEEVMPMPKSAVGPRPSVRDAIKKAVELSMGGAFGTPTTAQINQLYLAMQDDYDRATRPVEKSERDKAYEIFTNEFIFDNKRMPNPKEARELYQRAATSGTRQYSEGFMVRDSNGNFVGHTFLNNNTGEVLVSTLDGRLVKMTSDYIPTTASSFQRDVLPVDKFLKLRSEVTDDEISLNRMSGYVKKVKDLPTGIKRLADEVAANFKTLFGDKLTREQVAQKVARGELQGLIGAVRLSTVGGGVMTEQDAMRVIARLGGNLDAWQNPEVVQRAIADVYGERYRRYQDNINAYNMAVDVYYGKKGSQGEAFYKSIKPIQMDQLMEQGATGVFGAPATLEEKRERLKALQNR